MKRSFLTASMLAVGSLIAIAPNATAQTVVGDPNAYFASVDILAACTATPLLPGFMEVVDGEPEKLSSQQGTGSAATITVLCNVPYTLEADDANTEELTAALSVLNGTTLTGFSDFSNYNAAVVDAPALDVGVAAVREVELTAETDDGAAVQPGVYAFRVPLTLTTN